MGMPQQNFIRNNDKNRGTRYKPRDAGTDTADHGHGEFAFHDSINTPEFTTNSCVTGKDTAGCRRSRFARFTARWTRGNPPRTRISRERMPRKPILRAQIADSNAGIHCKPACHGNKSSRSRPQQNRISRCNNTRGTTRACYS